MSTSPSRLSYIDAYNVLDQALASSFGLRLTFADEGAARSFQLRLNMARRLNREDNALTYAADHPMHGQSEYDALIIRLRSNGEGSVVVVVEKVDREMKIEEIKEGEEI